MAFDELFEWGDVHQPQLSKSQHPLSLAGHRNGWVDDEVASFKGLPVCWQVNKCERVSLAARQPSDAPGVVKQSAASLDACWILTEHS